MIKGIVIRGKESGSEIGFPTANIDFSGNKSGVYAVYVNIQGFGRHKGVANIGTAPTFGKRKKQLEVHIFDFSEDIYGKEIEITLVQKIRDEKKFDSAGELKCQIVEDCKKARKIL